MNFKILTLGFKVNTYESNVMLDALINKGYIESEENIATEESSISVQDTVLENEEEITTSNTSKLGTSFDKAVADIGMDSENRRDMARILGQDLNQKISLLLDFTERPRNVADPWYTRNFEITYDDISEGCEKFLDAIEK